MGSNSPEDEDRSAPVLGTWGAWYAVVLGTLLGLVLLFTVLGRVYR